jgi:hypothetical protein
MVSNKTVKAICGGGAWVIAAVLQVVPATWPNLLRPHPWAVGVLVLFGAIMFGYAMFGHEQSHGSVNSVGRDNSGDQFYAKGSVVHKGDIHYHHVAAVSEKKEVETEPPAFKPSPILEAIPRISIGGFNRALVLFDGNRFCFDDEGKVPLTVLVKNERAPLLQQGSKAHRVIAHIVFRHGDSEAIVDRAYWIGSVENQITFEAPQTKHLLIGFPVGDLHWKSFSNPNTTPVFTYGSEFAEFQPEERDVVFPDWLQVEISIISLKNNQTLAERTAMIERHGDAYSARWLT